MDIEGFVIIPPVTDDSSNDNSSHLSLSSNEDNVIFPVVPNPNPPQQRPLRVLNVDPLINLNDGANDSESDASSISDMSFQHVLRNNGPPEELPAIDVDGADQLDVDGADQLGNANHGMDDDILEMQVDIPANESLQHQASLHFVQEEELQIVTTLQAIGVIVVMDPNGNCFFSALIFGMYHNQVHPYFLHNRPLEDRLNNLAEQLRRVTNMRRDMRSFLEENIDLFTSDEPLILSAQDSLLNKLRDYSTSPQVIFQTIGDRLYIDGVDFTNGCSSRFWADVNQHLPLAALFLRVTIVCYFNVGINNEPNTTIAYYSGGESGEVTMHYLPGHYYTPPTTDCICLHYVGGNHFNYIRQLSYNGTPIGWDDLPFDPTDQHHGRHADDQDDVPSNSSLGDWFRLPSQSKKKCSTQDTQQRSPSVGYSVHAPSKSAMKGLGRTMDYQDYRHFSHFSHEDPGGVTKVHFKGPSNYTAHVPASELRDRLCVTAADGRLTHVSFHSGFNLRGDYFRGLFADIIPKHIALRANTSYTTKVGNDGPGKRGEYIVCFKGWCGFRKNGCPTTYTGGITSTELLKIVKKGSDDTLVEVQLKFKNQCVHNDNDLVRELRGQARVEAQKEVRSSPMYAKEMAKFHLAKMNGEQLLLNNHQGCLTSPSTIYNVNRENKRKSLIDKGINPKEGDFANIMNVVEKIEESDLQHRKSINDTSEVLPGIARKIQLFPELAVELYTRHILNFVGTLSLAGGLVIGIDGTGGLINFKDTKADGNTQHIIMTVQLSQCLIDRHTSEQFGHRLFTPIMIAERISNKNNATSIGSWLSNVIKHTAESMESYPDGEKGHVLQPIVVQMDCALELMNACITSFRCRDHVDCAARYNACVIIIVLHYEYLCSSLHRDNEESVSQKKICAEDAYKTIKLVSPSVYKQCKAHVYNAMRCYPSKKPRNKLPRAMREHFDKFEQLFKFVAWEATRSIRLSELIPRLCVIVTILQREYLPCDNFTVHSKTHHGHTLKQTRQIADDMHDVITNSAGSLLITDEDERDNRLRAVFPEGWEGDDITFSGDGYCQAILNNMEDMRFSVVYLNKVNKHKREGVVKFVFVISPYQVNEDGVEKIHQHLLGGIHVDISLPHKDRRIRNPLYCPEAATYIMNQWLKRVGLWSESVMELVNTAVDKNIFSHNQSLEGTFNSQKNYTSQMFESSANLPAFIHMRWNQSVGDGRLAQSEIQQAKSRIENKHRRRLGKSSPPTPVGNRVKEMNSEMKWRSTSGSVRGKLREYSHKVLHTIEVGNHSGVWMVDTNNRKAMWRELVSFSVQNEMSFMSYDQFLKWMKGELATPLREEWIVIIDMFHEFGLSKDNQH